MIADILDDGCFYKINTKQEKYSTIQIAVVRLPNGMFKIILSRQMLDALDEGSYTLTLEFQGSDDINVVIDVK